MKTAVVLVMAILLVSGLASAAPTEEYTPKAQERYEEMLGKLDRDKCLYVKYKFPYLEQQEGDEAAREKHKPIFIVWALLGAPIKEKLLCARDEDAVKKAMGSVLVRIEAVRHDDITYSRVQELISAMQGHLFTSAILDTGIYLCAGWLGVGRNSLRVARQETDVRNGSRFCALEEKSERKRMKTAVVLVMAILLVSGLASVASTEVRH
ncbi:Hypp2697 [Branchiostoma lanceolatum]|uniref:Hypp2697 protein n=1 Tax=Branchiostoma lanceolatum TaxID=7740 RepID=A0A8K0ERK0_BRALA|nr:Hypp2697 [Branchiostoma lanceolatum]